MSFAATTEQIKNRTKTVTRRMGWKFLKPGDLIEAVTKYRGVRKKNRKKLATIRVRSIHRERLSEAKDLDMVYEGFPHWSPQEFITFFCRLNKCNPSQRVTVIWFEYV